MSGKRPALCIVNPYEHGGGAEYQISLLIDLLAAADEYDIHYLTHFIDTREVTRRYTLNRVGGGGAIPRLGYIMDGRSLYRSLRDIGPRIIYQRVACAYTGICALYARRHARPMIWHVAHDTDVTREILDPARNIVRVRLEKWLVEYGARHATRIVVQTGRQAQLLHDNYSRRPDAIVGNFHPPSTEVIDKSGPLTVAWIANLKAWKRPEVFVRLAQALSMYSGVRFVMVGAPAAVAGELPWQDLLIRSIEATPNLQFMGRQSHEEVNALLARAHIFVNTSTHEGFPNTFIQAWLREAVVVSLQVDPDDVLQRGRVGIAAQSEPDLLQAVRRLLENAPLRNDYARRGREHAAAHHSLRNAQELIGLMEAWRRTLD